VTGSRPDRVADLVQREVARLLQFEVHDARLGFVTVTGVRMSADLRHARVFVSLLSEGDARAAAERALEAARGFIRRRLGQALNLRHTPEIAFSIDTSIEYGARIERLLQAVRDPEDPERR
jgi:ribosome-binding factor A